VFIIHLLEIHRIPEIGFEDLIKMDRIIGVDAIDKNRWRLICACCDKPKCCIQCVAGVCRYSLHPMCGKMRNYRMDFEQVPRIEENEPESWDVAQLIYCPRHHSEPFDAKVWSEKEKAKRERFRAKNSKKLQSRKGKAAVARLKKKGIIDDDVVKTIDRSKKKAPAKKRRTDGNDSDAKPAKKKRIVKKKASSSDSSDADDSDSDDAAAEKKKKLSKKKSLKKPATADDKKDTPKKLKKSKASADDNGISLMSDEEKKSQIAIAVAAATEAAQRAAAAHIQLSTLSEMAAISSLQSLASTSPMATSVAPVTGVAGDSASSLNVTSSEPLTGAPSDLQSIEQARAKAQIAVMEADKQLKKANKLAAKLRGVGVAGDTDIEKEAKKAAKKAAKEKEKAERAAEKDKLKAEKKAAREAEKEKEKKAKAEKKAADKAAAGASGATPTPKVKEDHTTKDLTRLKQVREKKQPSRGDESKMEAVRAPVSLVKAEVMSEEEKRSNKVLYDAMIAEKTVLGRMLFLEKVFVDATDQRFNSFAQTFTQNGGLSLLRKWASSCLIFSSEKDAQEKAAFLLVLIKSLVRTSSSLSLSLSLLLLLLLLLLRTFRVVTHVTL
jgi:colicin import membrane protein